MQLWIFYRSCDFMRVFYNLIVKSREKAEQLIIVKRSSLFKGMLGVRWVIIMS